MMFGHFSKGAKAMVSEEKVESLTMEQEDYPDWINKKWKIIQQGQIIRYLGFPFGKDVSSKNLFNKIWSKFETKLKN